VKVAVCSIGNELNSLLDPRFGRCANFVIVDSETDEVSVQPNPGAVMGQGAGIQAAQALSSTGVTAVIAANYGPNAFQALSSAGIKAYTGASGTVKTATEQLKNGQLREVSAPTVAGHHGMGGGMVQGQGFGRRGRGGR
jgi:predicted Fe-Mo cluster-binding NifX family protein